MVEIREIDRAVTWIKKGEVYVKRTVLTERIPVDDVPECRWCGDPMFDGRADRQFCSQAHRQAYWRSQQERAQNGNGGG